MKTNYDISKAFQDDLIEAYKKVAPLSWTQEEAYKRAVKMPAPRYYVSPKQAAQVIAPMVRGDFERVDFMGRNKRRMYYAIYNRVVELSEKRQFVGKSLLYITRFAVASPAPEFYVSYHCLAKIRSLLKHGLIDDNGKPALTPRRIRDYERLKAKRERVRAYREMRKRMKENGED